MKGLLTDRVERFGALGQAALGLVRAEGVALKSELEGNVRRLAGVLLLFVIALFAVFWALGALIFSLIEVGAQWLPRWAAALVLVAVLSLVALVLAQIARRRMSRFEGPAATVRRRAGEYQKWWEHRLGSATILGEPGTGGGGPTTPDTERAGSSRRPDA